MISIYIIKYQGLAIEIYQPGAAWTRALIYFAFCNLFSALTGTLKSLLSQPFVTNEQLEDPIWIILCGICFIYIFFHIGSCGLE
ncbi:MAG: hypothetical protein EAX86_05395 [Candidatus Heimdallarchaeota archaeon]|nr:hypothetical protein [Candidatus Heimdallarchaeota archaeon]